MAFVTYGTRVPGLQRNGWGRDSFQIWRCRRELPNVASADSTPQPGALGFPGFPWNSELFALDPTSCAYFHGESISMGHATRFPLNIMALLRAEGLVASWQL